MSEIKGFSGCPPLPSTHHLQSKALFKHFSELLRSSCPGSVSSFHILPLLAFPACKCELNMHWCEQQIQIPAPSLHLLAAPRLGAGCARGWGEILVQGFGILGNVAGSMLLGPQAFPLLIVMRADGPATARGCDNG